MLNYLIRRFLLSIVTIFGVTVVIFVAMRVLPGDPLAMIYGEGTGIYVLTEEEQAAARATLGLDKPLYMQYLDWMADVFSGELGHSFWVDVPIRDTILRRGPITAEIAFFAIVLAWLIGLPVGVISAMWRESLLDNVLRVVVTLFMAIPSFWLGLTMILFTVLVFNWRPSITIVQLWEDPVTNLSMVAGPAVAVGIGLAALIARMTRSTVLEVLGEDYVRTARAKGLSLWTTILRHVLKNAILPVITLSGLALAGLLGGSVAVEKAFGFPGLGSALAQGAVERDWMMVQNLTLIFALTFVFLNLLIDILYAWIDPRIRYE
ncbi:MAG: ABC transporter permease [Caldilineaceae bacterium]|nr:ABC transporter permease [Caldilineaceae bacterium]MCB0143869.1 ABC transporter permease [Caldilineaceae bacterium]